jgi:hypothetical protein
MCTLAINTSASPSKLNFRFAFVIMSWLVIGREIVMNIWCCSCLLPPSAYSSPWNYCSFCGADRSVSCAILSTVLLQSIYLGSSDYFRRDMTSYRGISTSSRHIVVALRSSGLPSVCVVLRLHNNAQSVAGFVSTVNHDHLSLTPTPGSFYQRHGIFQRLGFTSVDACGVGASEMFFRSFTTTRQ